MAARIGRPAGVAEPLPRGTVQLIEKAKQAERLGIKADEAWGVLLGVMRGEIKGRHLRERLSAAVIVLEHQIGKAKQKVELVDKRDGIYRSEFADGSPVRAAEDAPGLPN